LTAEIGEVGKKLHTARSRNDQVATDLRLYLREVARQVQDRLAQLSRVLIDRAEAESETLMPGYTHLQPAQPITLGHHLLAYFEMFYRDLTRVEDCLERANYSPLGAGALAGVTYPIDRELIAQLFGLTAPMENILDDVRG